MDTRNEPSYYTPTPYEFAALSYDIYRYSTINKDGDFVFKKDPNYPPLPPGWDETPYAITNGNLDLFAGLVAAFYIKRNERGIPIAMVMAIKGTDPSNIFTIVADVRKKFGFLSKECADAMNFYDNVYEKMHDQKDFIDLPINICGHSLGGLIANVVFAAKGHSHEACVTFDNPGGDDDVRMYFEWGYSAKEIAEKYNKLFPRCFNYVAHPNAINTCAKQFGYVFSLMDMPYDFSQYTSSAIMGFIGPDALFNPNYYLTNTLYDQHRMVNILNYLKGGGLYEAIYDHPIGFQKGYIDYLWVEKHSRYWNSYIDRLWELLSDDERISYKDKGKFIEKKYEQIKEARYFALMFLEKRKSLPTDFEKDKIAKFSGNKFALFAESPKNSLEEEFVMIEKEVTPKKNSSRCHIM